MTDFAYGDVLKKRFILIKKLGSGASATVWLALDCKQDIFVSIKAFDKDDYDDAQHEISIYKSLTPDLNIMLHYFESHGRMCIVFPLYGGNLYDVTKNIGLDAELCDIIFNKIARIMNSLKQCNIVHNDIKPENIMFAEPLSKPIERIINSFKDKGGIHYYIGMKKSLPNMAKCILDDILLQSDYDDTLSEAYNSSNDSNSDDSEDEFSDTSSEDSTETVPTNIGALFFLNVSISSTRALYFAVLVRKTKSLWSFLIIGTFVGIIMTSSPYI